MDIKEIRALPDEALLNLLEDKKQDMWVLRRDRVTGELKDLNRLHYSKRDIARIKTVLRERQLAAQVASKEKGNG
jgi:large subunit ribosomal protein L29